MALCFFIFTKPDIWGSFVILLMSEVYYYKQHHHKNKKEISSWDKLMELYQILCY